MLTNQSNAFGGIFKKYLECNQMKNIKFLFSLLGLSIIPLTSQASLTIKLDDGIHSAITISDNTSSDLSNILGVNLISQTLGNWAVNVVTSANLGSTPTSPTLSLTSFNLSYTGPGAPTSPLKVFLTDTGYGPNPGLFDIHIGGTQNATATITSRFFYGTNNNPFDETNQIGTTQNFSTASYSNDQSAVGPAGTISSPYSLTIETDISNVPNGSFTSQFTSSLSVSSVPLPATIPLLMTGLGFIGLFGRRNKLV